VTKTAKPNGDWPLVLLAALLVLVCAPGLLRAVLAVPLRVPLDYNEGWNAYHTAAAFSPGDLYPHRPRFFFNNYPPLSFLIVGALARGRDAIVAGRVVSLIAFACLLGVLFRAARLMGCSREESLFGSALFLTCTLAFSVYIGIDDPEFIAHAVQGVGLLLILGEPRTSVRIIVAAAFCAGGVFVKHNAIALPLAAGAWLALIDRPAARRLVAGGAAFGLAGLATCQAVFGSRFFSDVTAGRPYWIADVAWSTAGWAVRMPVFIAALVALQRRFRQDRDVLFCALYASIATIAGLAFRGGEAVGWNVMFDSSAALCVSSALALNRVSPARPGRRSRRLALAGAYALGLVIMAVVVAATTGTGRAWVTLDHWRAPTAAAADAGRDIEFLSRADGPAACEELSLCYWAGKPAEIDFLSMRQRIRTGSRSGGEVLALIESRYFGAIQLDSLKTYFDPRFMGVLLGAYVVDHTDRHGVFLVRKP
jgi:hypothetical protein